jgi:hypothetical protein
METLSNFKVTDKKSFIAFIELLRQDLKENPGNWENDNLDNFLEAIGSYTEDIQGYYDNTNQNVDSNEATWKIFANIFQGAKIYE